MWQLKIEEDDVEHSPYTLPHSCRGFPGAPRSKESEAKYLETCELRAQEAAAQVKNSQMKTTKNTDDRSIVKLRRELEYTRADASEADQKHSKALLGMNEELQAREKASAALQRQLLEDQAQIHLEQHNYLKRQLALLAEAYAQDMYNQSQRDSAAKGTRQALQHFIKDLENELERQRANCSDLD